MSLQMRWVGEADWDRVAETRARCYGSAIKEQPRFAEGIRADRRAKAGDYLLAEQEGIAVGTATCLSLAMWLRGARVACQGVAWVGTIKTHRRGTKQPGGGVASQIMREAIRLGRERGEIVSALMPFRGSFYEHFGYGVVERLCTWTVPLAILPTGDFSGMRFFEAEELPALAACRQRIVQRGQCDIERTDGSWGVHLKRWEDGLLAVDRSTSGEIHGYAAFQHVQKNEKDHVQVNECGYEDVAGLRRLLHFLGSLRDQYTFASLTLPADLPLNRILRETQVPHRLVNHPHAELKSCTRMAVRVLDHKKLLEAMELPPAWTGKVVVAIRESEGHLSRLAIDVGEGRASAMASEATPDFECDDRTWAAIVCGDLSAAQAERLGLACADSAKAVEVLNVFAQGAVPFCQEYF